MDVSYSVPTGTFRCASPCCWPQWQASCSPRWRAVPRSCSCALPARKHRRAHHRAVKAGAKDSSKAGGSPDYREPATGRDL